LAKIIPFRALRPQPQFAKQVASPPYDVLNSNEARQLAQGNPNTFLHVTKAEIDLPEDADIHSQEVYDKARQNLQAFTQREVLFREDKPCFYIYELTMNGRSQTGLVCASAIDDYDADIIKKHEFTRPDKELDRINHIKTTGAQTGNVFLAYRNIPGLDTLVNNWKNDKNAIYDFVADDGIEHKIWVISDRTAIDQVVSYFSKQAPFTYIADGHHRAASAAKVRRALTGKISEEANYFLTTLFPANELRIMDYNRVVKDLKGMDAKEFLTKLGEHFTVESKGNTPYSPERLHEFGLYLDHQWYKLSAKPGSYSSDPIGVLDVTILQEKVLDPLLGIKDQRTDKRIDFVGGIRGLGELERRVNNGDMKLAFSLYPVSIEQLFDIADSGQVMPPKSTWFEPKLRDGLITHLIN